MHALEHLYVDNNQLTSLILPGSLTALIALTLSWNKLTSLTIHKSWNCLQTLHVQNNQLTNLIIPERLTSLHMLNFNDNPLSITSLHVLRALKLKYVNPLVTFVGLPEDLGRLTEGELIKHLSFKFKDIISNLSLENQKQYLLNYLKFSIKLVLANSNALSEGNRWPMDVVHLAAKATMQFGSWETNVHANNELLAYLKSVFSYDNTMRLSDIQRAWLDDLKQVVEKCHNWHVKAINDKNNIKEFEKDVNYFISASFGCLPKRRYH